MSELRELALNQLKLDNCVIQGIVGKIKEFIGQELRSLHRSMIEIIKEIFPPKTGMRKATSLQDPGYVGEVEDCVLHGNIRNYCRRRRRWPFELHCIL